MTDSALLDKCKYTIDELRSFITLLRLGAKVDPSVSPYLWSSGYCFKDIPGKWTVWTLMNYADVSIKKYNMRVDWGDLSIAVFWEPNKNIHVMALEYLLDLKLKEKANEV